MKNKFNSDDDLPLKKPLKLHATTIIIRFVFEEDGKFYLQVNKTTASWSWQAGWREKFSPNDSEDYGWKLLYDWLKDEIGNICQKWRHNCLSPAESAFSLQPT